jgi:hypothetical protein
MKFNKLVLTGMVLLLAIALLAASNHGTTLSFGIKKGDTVEFTNGRAGISFTKSQYNGQVQLTRVSESRRIPGEDKPNFIQKPIDLRLTDKSDVRITHILGSVYVLFLVRRAEVRAFDKGDLSIYFFDTWTQTWEKCDTFAVTNGAGVSRLACRMRVFGMYGLAEK